MAISIIDWQEELAAAKHDPNVGIKIATLLESNKIGTYITVIQPGKSVNPHYHQYGNEEYHIVKGSGVIRLVPLNKKKILVCKQLKSGNSFIIPPNMIHQLINNSCEPLTLLFSCPQTHLAEDRYIINNVEQFLNG